MKSSAVLTPKKPLGGSPKLRKTMNPTPATTAPKTSEKKAPNVPKPPSDSFKPLETRKKLSNVQQHKLGQLRSKDGKAGTDAVKKNLSKNGLALKAMDPKISAGEKDSKSIGHVQMRGERVETRAKEWRENGTATPYLTRQQALAYKVGYTPTETPVTQVNSNPRANKDAKPETVKNATLTQQGKPLSSLEGNTRTIHVMDAKGQVYAATEMQQMVQKDSLHRRVDVHHSSLVEGQSVASAGELVTDSKGTLKKVSDRSGHYLPEGEHTLQGLKQMEKNGVNLDNVKLETHNGDAGVKSTKVTKGMAREFQQGKGSHSLFEARHDVMAELTQKTQSRRQQYDSMAEMRLRKVKHGGSNTGMASGASAPSSKNALPSGPTHAYANLSAPSGPAHAYANPSQPSGPAHAYANPSDRYAKTPADDRYAKTPADDRYAKTPADDRYAKTPADDRYAKTPADDRSAKTPADDRSAKTPAEASHGAPTHAYANPSAPSGPPHAYANPSDRSAKTPTDDRSAKTPTDASNGAPTHAYANPSAPSGPPHA